MSGRDDGAELKYRRVLLKLSGEALAGEQGFGISGQVVDALTEEIRRRLYRIHRRNAGGLGFA